MKINVELASDLMDRKNTIRSLSILWLSTLIGAGSAFLIQVFLAHILSPIEFGTFASAIATVTLLVPLANFGVFQYLLKVFGRHGWVGTNWLLPSYRLTVTTNIIVVILSLWWAFTGPHDLLLKSLLIILTFNILGQVSLEFLNVKLQIEERYEYLALVQCLPNFLRLILILVGWTIYRNEMTATIVALAYVFISFLLMTLSIIQFSKMLDGKFLLPGHIKNEGLYSNINIGLMQVVGQSWPFALAALFHLIYFQSDIILVNYILGPQAAGIYNVAFTVLVPAFLLASVLYQKFLLSRIHRWSNQDLSMLHYVYKRGNIIMLVFGLVLLIVTLFLAPVLIPLMFGRNFIESVLPLQYLALSLPLVFIASNSGAMLNTGNNIKIKVICMGSVALLNVILNIFFIPKYGIPGAVFATVFSYFLLSVMYYGATNKYVFKNIINI